MCACVCGGGSWGCLDELIKIREKTWKDGTTCNMEEEIVLLKK